MQWLKHRKVGIKPKIIDKTSSSDCVYVCKNIIETEQEYGEDKQLVKVYDYLEATIPKEDWENIEEIITTQLILQNTNAGLIETYEETLKNTSEIELLKKELETLKVKIGETNNG